MPVPNVTVSLSEVLEVRGSPLTETEIWALLCLGAEVLQDSFISEEAISEFGPAFVINPDTISLTPGGQIEFGHAQRVQQYANYMAPETEEGFVMTATTVEQIYVYALGKSLVYSAEFGLNPEELSGSSSRSEKSKPLKISRGLESLLGGMTNRNPTERTALVKVLEACSIQSTRNQRGKQSLSHVVLDLYRTVLGVEGQEDSIPDTPSDRYRPTTSPQETDPDRSRRKKRRSRNSGRNKKRSPIERYRSRSRSRSSSYSRSRSHSKQNGKDRGRKRSDSPDSGYHRHTPLVDENYGISSRPSLHSAVHSTGRSYHLSDITFSASQNGQNSKRKSSSRRPDSRQSSSRQPDSRQSSSRRPDSRQSRTGNKPQSNGNVKGSLKDSDIKENPAFKKYLKLKERQRKLRVLRSGLVDSTESDELSDIVMDHMSETRSVMSLVSQSQGAYRPDIHKQYGSNSALKMGQESDLDSVISSDVSVFGHDQQALRANGDISDPYIQQLQQMTAAPPPPPVFATKPPAVKHKQKQTSPKHVSHPPQKHKEYYGPEFVHRSTKPISRIALPLQGEYPLYADHRKMLFDESRKNPGRVCRVVIVLLNGQKLEVMCELSTTGQQLFEAIVTHIELPEFYFFGLTYVSDDEHFFIPAETKLHKVAPDGWKESWKVQSAPVTFTVYLRVKFYVENLAALKHETTRHQLYLQLRRDLLEERCQCDETKALALAGLALQAEYGDYSQENMGRNYFVPEHYFPGRAVKRLGSGYIRDNTPEAHMDTRGLTETEAEVEFIKFVQEHLPEYGTHFHKLLKKKGDTSNTIWIGLNIDEMVLAENSGGQRIIVQQHPWGAIQKISFNRRRFSVQPRPDIGQVKPVKMNFFTTTYRKGQYLLKFCTAQHSFQLKMKSRLAMSDETGLDPTIPDHESIGNTEDMDSHSTDDEGTITEEHINPTEADVEMQAIGYAGRDDALQNQPITYRSPPPYRPYFGSSLIDLPGPKLKSTAPDPGPRDAASENVHQDGVSQSSPAVKPSEAVDHNVEEKIIPSQASDANNAYVIDMSTGSMDQTLSPLSGNETISNTLHQRFKDDLLSPESSAVEREVFDVILAKEPEFGIGITIVGGDINRKHDLGIFVKSVTVNGPAHRDSRIKPGDRILAINDRSVEGLPHHKAVKIIKKSSSHVKLKISQVKPPRSLRKKDNDDALFQMKLKGSFVSEPDNDNIPLDTKTSPSDRKSSPSQSADEIITPVINVEECASVHSDEENVENDKKFDGQMTSIPDDVIVTDDGLRSHADVHSTLSQVDSLNSELAVQELPADEQTNISEIHEDSDTDSDFDSRIDAVINETPVVDEQILAETEETVMSANRKQSESSPDTPTETFDVFLEKKRGSFGLNVTGGVNTSVRFGGIYVKSVVPDSAADEEGTIQKGDRILMVDSIELEGFTHKQAVQTLYEAPPLCRLVIERGLIIPSRPASTGSRKSQRSENRRFVDNEQRLQEKPSIPVAPESSTEHVNVLEMSLTAGTVEFRTGEVEPDVRVSVDEMQIDQNLSWERRNLLLAINQLYESFITKENCYQVRLKKGTQGLGFSIIGGEAQVEGDPDTTLHYVTRIKRVFPIGPAADCQKVEAGDVILSVNGQDMRKLTHAETLLALRTAGKAVTLILCRPEPGILAPLLFLESQESLELTPASSSFTDSSDSDNDNDSDYNNRTTTPAREMLITPPTGFSPQKYPVDENGSILPKVASPPPPLPQSPPPTLPQSPPPTLVCSGSVTPPSVTVELGVAELMDSCRSEMVEIQQSTEGKTDGRDTTPVVREFSTLGFETSSEATPINIAECSTAGSEDLNSVNLDILNETSSSSKVSTPKFPNKDEKVVSQSVLRRGDACDQSDSESESSASSGCNKSTSFTDTRQDTSLVDSKLDTSLVESRQNFSLVDSKQEEASLADSKLEISLADSRLDSSSEQEGEQSLSETDNYETTLEGTYTLETEAKSLDTLNACSENVVSDECDIIDVDNVPKYVNEDTDVNNDDIDASIKLLEQKYLEIDEEDENVDETESEESTSTDEEQSSVRETFSQVLEESLHPGELEVTLTKPEGKGLGFTVAGGASTTGGCYIKAVLQNPALSDGRLKPGDRLIKVNGIDMRSLNHFEAVTVLREAADQVVIRIYREPKDDLELDRVYDAENQGQANVESPPGQTKDETIGEGTLETESLDEQTSESESEDSSQGREPSLTENRDPVCEDGEAVCQTEDRQPVHELDSLDRETKDRSPVQDQTKSLEESFSRAPAEGGASDGKNQSDDGLSQKEALLSSPKSPHSPEVSVCQIDLEKPPAGGLGISLVTMETENQTGVFIRTISPEGVAHSDGRLRVGDKVLQINGQSLVGLNHSKAATILRNSEGRVMLTVSRNREKKPQWLDRDEEEKCGKEAENQEKFRRSHFEQAIGPDADSDNDHSDNEGDSSLSLTKHLPEDIKDDNVDSLVLEAEKILDDAENVLEYRSEVESFPNSQDDTGAQAITVSQAKIANNEEGLDDKTHSYLRAAETIEYHHGELDPDADSEQIDHLHDVNDEDSSEILSDQESERHNENDSEVDEKEIVDYEEDFDVDDNDNNQEAENDEEAIDREGYQNVSEIENVNNDDGSENNDASKVVEDNDDEDISTQCWSDSLRRLDIPIPDEVTSDWLYELLLATVPEEVKSSIPGLIAELQDKIEIDDPQEEFKQLRTVKPTDDCTAANLVYNRDRNRFRNVLPYDLNRVRLSEDSATDYINASHVQIDVAGVICDYIACQGPLPHTTDDFWEMMWLHEVTVIVMLTRDMEAGKVKCHRYWPDSVDTPIEVCEGRYRLSLLYENVLDDFDIRSILIENLEAGESRSVCHLNYTTWPDHGVPQSAVPLLQCMRLSHELRVSGPLVVHCSAGIGRTGTFITIDVALAHVEKSLKCEIFDIVTELRRQRQGMIQTRDQYLFCYTAIIEALLNNAG